MGQYWKPVNLDKKEFIDPHKLGSGLKLVEQLDSYVGTALVILTAACKDHRGGGDFDIDENWHGPERTFPIHNTSPGPMPSDYPSIARRTIGRWAGDRVAIVGNYAEDSDLPRGFKASEIYGKCYSETETYEDDNPENALYMTPDGKHLHNKTLKPSEFTDITNDVCKVIEHELRGKFEGDWWRNFKYLDDKL